MSDRPAPRDPDETLIEALAEQIRDHRTRYYNDVPMISDAEFDALENRLRTLAPTHPALSEVGAAPPSGPSPSDGAKAFATPHDSEQLAAQLFLEAERAYDGHAADKKLYESLWFALSKLAPKHDALTLVPPPQGQDWPKARHEIPMGSLNKVNSEDELRDWATRCDELAEKAELPPIGNDLALTEKLDGISIEVVYAKGQLEAALTRGDGITGERITANVLRM